MKKSPKTPRICLSFIIAILLPSSSFSWPMEFNLSKNEGEQEAKTILFEGNQLRSGGDQRAEDDGVISNVTELDSPNYDADGLKSPTLPIQEPLALTLEEAQTFIVNSKTESNPTEQQKSLLEQMEESFKKWAGAKQIIEKENNNKIKQEEFKKLEDLWSNIFMAVTSLWGELSQAKKHQIEIEKKKNLLFRLNKNNNEEKEAKELIDMTVLIRSSSEQNKRDTDKIVRTMIGYRILDDWCQESWGPKYSRTREGDIEEEKIFEYQREKDYRFELFYLQHLAAQHSEDDEKISSFFKNAADHAYAQMTHNSMQHDEIIEKSNSIYTICEMLDELLSIKEDDKNKVDLFNNPHSKSLYKSILKSHEDYCTLLLELGNRELVKEAPLDLRVLDSLKAIKKSKEEINAEYANLARQAEERNIDNLTEFLPEEFTQLAKIRNKEHEIESMKALFNDDEPVQSQEKKFL